MRILLSAYACSPYRGSEFGVGWNFAAGLAAHGDDVTVLFGDLSAVKQSKRDLEKYQESSSLPKNLRMVHVPPDSLTRMLNDLHTLPGMWFIYYMAYRRWQKIALRTATRLHKEQRFDLVHHLTIIGYREPGYLWQLGIPFVWGPVSGASMVPLSFIWDFGLKERFRWFSHRFFNSIQMRLRGRWISAAMAAKKIWAVSVEDQEAFKRWSVATELMPEVGCRLEPGIVRKLVHGQPLRICWSGYFAGRKALPLLLRALAAASSKLIELHIMGDGPEALRWKRLSKDLGLHERVRWHGMLERDKALGLMDQCHVLVHTSVKEASSTVVIEAIERGLPVICHDACGMGILINESCGIKVPLVKPEISILGFKEALNRILSSPELLENLSSGSMLRAKSLSWESKIVQVSGAYQSIIRDAHK